MIAGCSTAANHHTSTDHKIASNHRNPPLPTVTGVAPPTGTTAGGTTVTVTGTGFTGATKVLFGAVPAASYTVVSDTVITAVSPAQGPSIQDIHVSTAGGTSEPVVAIAPFTYVTPVSGVTRIAPSTGTTAGGTTVTITGTGFTGATKV
ncbi:MAG: IPT/TIG domain-containing protein, partial [Acidimicrobiales bacterium]